MRKLGQHFLKSQNIVNIIVKTADLDAKDVVLEIGPGTGILTKVLIEKTGKVVAVEKDKNLSQSLAAAFKNEKNFELITADVRDFLKSEKSVEKLGKNYKIVSNIPYYLTSHLFELVLERAKNQPKMLVLMVQKEVGQRIIAKPPHTNIFGLAVQAYGKPKIAAKVPKTCFRPRPKVDSCIVSVAEISKNFFKDNKIREKDFFSLIRKGFSHKRKLLLGNLAGKNGKFEKSRVLEAFKDCQIEEKSRAENLSLEKWACLLNGIKK